MFRLVYLSRKHKRGKMSQYRGGNSKAIGITIAVVVVILVLLVGGFILLFTLGREDSTVVSSIQSGGNRNGNTSGSIVNSIGNALSGSTSGGNTSGGNTSGGNTSGGSTSSGSTSGSIFNFIGNALSGSGNNSGGNSPTVTVTPDYIDGAYSNSYGCEDGYCWGYCGASWTSGEWQYTGNETNTDWHTCSKKSDCSDDWMDWGLSSYSQVPGYGTCSL